MPEIISNENSLLKKKCSALNKPKET